MTNQEHEAWLETADLIIEEHKSFLTYVGSEDRNPSK
jgi:hypothetical protein